MTDVQEPMGLPVARNAAGGVQRAGRWRVAAVLAGAAMALGVSPAAAENAVPMPPTPPKQPVRVQGTDYPGVPVPFVERGQTAAVTFGIKDSTPVGYAHGYPAITNNWEMIFYAPDHTAFADDTLTPVGDAVGSWSCTRLSSGSFMQCTSTYAGPPPPVTGAQWQVNLTVLPDAPSDTMLTGGYGVLQVASPDPDASPHWNRWDTPNMSLSVGTCPAQQG
ncbi:hypothetical protein GCM10010278_41040 [Streptomyces melanogenes]|nr:hypothetical protein GCM10010278_41040 [Streptomyces melanogenes]